VSALCNDSWDMAHVYCVDDVTVNEAYLAGM
jgi:hypothetical protein